MKNYSKLFGLTKPERTTEMSARNVEIEQNRKKVSGGTVLTQSSHRSWLTAEAIGWIIRCRNIKNSKRKRGDSR